MRPAGAWIQDSAPLIRQEITLPPNEWQSFRLAVVINLTVNVQPRLLLVRRQMLHDFHQIAHHLFANPSHQRRSLWGNTNHHLSPVLARTRAHDIARIFKPRHQAARSGRRVTHLLRNRRHRQYFLLIEVREQKELRERNVTRRQLLTQMQHETALHFQNNMGQTLGICSNWVRLNPWRRSNKSRVQRA